MQSQNRSIFIINISLKLFLAGVVLSYGMQLQAQDTLRLYASGVPNSKPVQFNGPAGNLKSGMVFHVINPLLEIYLPDKTIATGAAVIICPGGGYKVLTYQAEGIHTAKAFQQKGIAAFVLKYRLPDEASMIDPRIGPLQDAQQAIKLVREHASKWGIDSSKIGIMGFSAGGHLASTAATHFDSPVIDNKAKTNLRPDFLILVYPVISMQNGLTHLDSRHNLLGKAPTKQMIDDFSNELQVTDSTPPAYITHAGDDQLVDVDNSIVFYESLRHHHVPAELHLFPNGGHGFVLRLKPDDWMAPLFTWMKTLNLIPNELRQAK